MICGFIGLFTFLYLLGFIHTNDEGQDAINEGVMTALGILLILALCFVFVGIDGPCNVR